MERIVQNISRIFLSGIIIISLNSCENDSAKVGLNEFVVYNMLLDSLCQSIVYCQRTFIFWDYGSVQKEKDYVKINKERNKEFQKFIDSTEVIIIISDSLKKLDFKGHRGFIFGKLEPSDTLFRNFIDEKSINIYNARIIPENSLVKERTKFLPNRKARKNNRPEWYGLYNDTLWLGWISMSRIAFNDANNLGIFFFEFVGGGLCGYGEYILIKKINNRWIIHQRIRKWVS